jgi:hypothetical protein
MWFDAMYCLFVFFNVFNIFGQEQLHTMLFYFLLVTPKTVISLFSLASGEVNHGLIIQISHYIMHQFEDTFSFLLRYTFLSPNLKLLLHKKRN